MARPGVFFTLLCVCSAGWAQDSPDLSSLVFWPRPPATNAAAARPRDGALPRVAPASQSPDAGTPSSGEKSDSDRTALSKAVEEHLDSLGEETSLNGERSPGLIDELTALGALYQQLGHHDQAIAALEDAIQTIRINYGLHSLDQVDAVESVVSSRQAEGEYQQANNQREYIRDLVRRNADDPRTVGILSELASSEMDAARRLIRVPAPPEISFTSSSGPDLLRQRSAPPQRPSLIALYSARRDYVAAINAAVRTDTGNAADLFALQDALIGTVYFEYEHPELYRGGARWRSVDPSPLYVVGLRILQGKVINTVNFRQTPVAIAKALIELGDWYLLFHQNGIGLDKYQLAHDTLVEQGESRETIDRLFSPEVPVPLPVLPAGIRDTGPGRAYRGYIDVAIDINRYGGIRSVDVLGKSSGTFRAIERRLRSYIYRGRFRPRFVDDELVRSDHFAERFYYTY